MIGAPLLELGENNATTMGPWFRGALQIGSPRSYVLRAPQKDSQVDNLVHCRVEDICP